MVKLFRQQMHKQVDSTFFSPSLSLILDPCRQHAQIRVSEFTNSCVYLCLCAWPQLQPQLLPLSLNIGIKRLFIFGNHM